MALNVPYRPSARPQSLVLSLSIGLVALGVALAPLSIPLGPARVAPQQHMINALAGVLVGPWYGMLVGCIIAIIRNAFGTGTILAFPGSVFGALVVGLVYWYGRRSDYAALLEPIGTVVIGATIGYLMLAPLGPNAHVKVFGFMAANAAPPAGKLWGLVSFPGLFGLWAIFASSSIPGSILGFVLLKALRRAGAVPDRS